MRLFTLAFLAGTLYLQQSSRLPESHFAWAGVAVLLTAFLARRGGSRVALLALAGGLLGFGHAAWRAHERLADALPFEWEGRDVRLTGVVADLPQPRERATRFVLHVEHVQTPGAVVPRRLSLAWYPHAAAAAPPTLVAGERWALTVRLKRVRGLANPHAFDFEPWALERGIRASGYVRAAPAAARLDNHAAGWPQTLNRWRGEIRASMHARLGEAPFAGVLVALAIGDQDAIAPGQWDVFWRTGVGHLMSISGLHITMLGALGFAIAFFLWSRVPALALRLPARKAAALAGVAVALAYALMTGFAVPAQRTTLMLAVAALAVLADRHGSPSRVLALAALAVLVADPWAVLSPGFWLSFGAVAAIFYVMSLRVGGPGRLRAAAGEQLAVSVVMVPMLLALFQEVSVVSPLANAFAIPVVSWVVVPLALAGAFLAIGPALEAAHATLAGLMVVLERMAALPHAMLESHAPTGWAVAAAVVGCAWLLAPRGVPMRTLGLLWLAPLYALAPQVPGWGEAWADVLDVGSGLAVVVRTHSRVLAYDAGPTWGDESDSGERIVVPYLRGEGVRRLDALVVSHADDDHAGGAISVAALRAPAWMLSSLPAGDALHALVPRSTRCAAGQSWTWDGVGFEVLHPAPGPGSAKPNDLSCVLRVSSAGGALLLTGDIEARSEAEILRRGGRIDAAILLVPHHGSRTSSTPAFIEAVAPSTAVVSAAHRSRFGHPNPAVVARYGTRGIALRRTDQEGALRVVLPGESGGAPRVERLVRQVRYWSDRRPP